LREPLIKTAAGLIAVAVIVAFMLAVKKAKDFERDHKVRIESKIDAVADELAKVHDQTDRILHGKGPEPLSLKPPKGK
jgi:hypothetical protein